MSKVIAVMQNKGGTLKTTLTTNLAGVLSQKPHYKVLIIDFDSQNNVISSFGEGLTSEGLYSVLKRPHTWKQEVIPVCDRLVVLPGSTHLSSIDLMVGVGKIQNPIKAFQQIKTALSKDFTHVFIDTPPTINLLWITAVQTADEIIVPLQMEHYAVGGLVKTISLIKNHNHNAKIFIVPTLFDPRTKLHRSVLASVSKMTKKQGIKLTPTQITRSVKAAKAVAYHKKPLIFTKGRSKQKHQYHKLAQDLEYVKK